MSSYADQLKEIRAARATRDQARDELYTQLIEQLKLLRTQRKAQSKETADDPAALAKIASLRATIAADADKLRTVQDQLSSIAGLESTLADAQNLLKALLADPSALVNQIAAVKAKLDKPDLPPDQKAALQPKLASLSAQSDALAKRIAQLREQIAGLQQQVRGTQDRKQQLNQQAAGLQGEIAQSQSSIAQLAKSGHAIDDPQSQLDQVRQRIAGQRQELNARESAVSAVIDQFFAQQTPQTLVEQWSDATPIILLPLRVETKFEDADKGNQLWVRVYPDEVAVTTHEKILTDREVNLGIAYWKALRDAADDKARADAWRTLAAKFGANRAAWVALQTKPLNWTTPPPASDADLHFPDITTTKPDNWTEAPHSVVMPDCFVLMLYRSEQLIYTQVGRRISDRLIVGPAPLVDEGNPSITRNPADNRLQYGADFEWLLDFPTAVARGMGFIVDLNATDAQLGFDQLLVLGLKLTTDDADGEQLIEDLIDDHHYSSKGFSLVKQGTATNNTDANDSQFSTSDWMHGVSYFVEVGDPLFTPVTDANQATDGQRLAEYLGIRYELLQHISNADATDHGEAVAMNRALYAGTLGYYLNSMLNEVMSIPAMQSLREFSTDFVTGRGPIATIRVGSQPYGMLLTSNFSKWAYPPPILERRVPFDEQVSKVLLYLEGQWETVKAGLSHISKSGNASDNLMKVLGLQPTSADYYHRVGYSYDYLRNLAQFELGGKYFGDVIATMLEGIAGRQFLASFGYQTTRPDGTPKPTPLLFQLIYQHYQTRLDNQNLIDNLPLDEARAIKPYDTGTGKNYINWLLDNISAVDKLEQEDFGTGITKPNALLYLMLRNALLVEAGNSVYHLLAGQDIVADEMVRSRKFMNISSQPDVSHWEAFRAPANRIIPGEVSEQPLLSYVQLDRFKTVDVGRYLDQTREALQTLSGLPTARLERVFAEHIDTLNYRLDAWQTALFDRRLRSQRQLDVQGERRTGIYLGSYGYLENVQPAQAKRQKIPDDVLPVPLREGKDNLYLDPSNGGYVHTPSLNHATAAAILRNGYLTHSSPADREKLSVNMSSDRVRQARDLIDGVRNGQPLEVLLGYLFERGLHDWTTQPVGPVILDQLKPLFRAAFPTKRTKIPRQGFDSEPAEVIDDYSVTNGLDLANTTADFPYGIANMPALDNTQIAAVKTEKSNLENVLDALRDVLTAESMYQLALGNFDRAAAVMQAISGGDLPVEIDVINSSRGTDLGFTNRVTLQFDPGVSANPWPAITMTRRARTEPAFNNWAGTMIGDPATIKCTARAVDASGNPVLDGRGNPIQGVVTLADLNVQALDFVYLIRKKVDATGYSEIESRVRYAFATKLALSDTTIVQIEFANSGGGAADRSFAEILPFADAIREMAGKARPLQAQDFASASKTVAVASDNPGNLDIDELKSRVAGIRTEFDSLFSITDVAATDADALKTEGAVDTLRQSLLGIATAGVPHAFPLSSTGFGDAERTALLTQSNSLHSRYETVKAAYDQSLAQVNAAGAKPPGQLRLLTAMARAFLGEDFVLLPHFTLIDPADVTLADANRDQLLKYAQTTMQVALPVEEWLHGVSLVRPNLHTFATVLMLGDTFNHDTPPCSPLQLPYRDNDTWLSIEFAEGTTIVHDTIAIMQCLPQGFQPAGVQTGLLIDEWTETLPQKQEVSGIAFNYDQPNSAPPSAILLAVTPAIAGKWQWNDLTATVLDTFERAKLRAVEPDIIDTIGGFSTLLPATISEFSTSGNGISLDYLFNIKYVADQVTTLSTTAFKG
jgi:uncharacterized coiled-coil DUF342 family protein